MISPANTLLRKFLAPAMLSLSCFVVRYMNLLPSPHQRTQVGDICKNILLRKFPSAATLSYIYGEDLVWSNCNVCRL